MAVNMVNDIVSGHRARMLNLKKYYPFFKLTEISLSQFKDGKYEILDMGYIVMGILRFFIEENNFNEKDVTYPEYLEFFHELISRDFGLLLSEEENTEIGGYIFDKIISVVFFVVILFYVRQADRHYCGVFSSVVVYSFYKNRIFRLYS